MLTKSEPGADVGPSWRTSVAVHVLALAALALAVILLGDARTASGSDAGGKLATVVAMAENGSWSPDLGYWANDTDPRGLHHPLWHTEPLGDQWIQATSIPFVIAARPLLDFGGPLATLALPVAGCLLAALGARRIDRVLNGSDGWAAFWLVGAAGPVLFYAGDFWEHAPALGLGLLAVSLALDADTPARGALVGLAAGLAVVLRAEMLLYGVVFIMASVAVSAERHRWTARPRVVAAAVMAGGAALLANTVVERLVLEQGGRAARAGTTVSSAGAGLAGRGIDALVTSVGLFADDDPAVLFCGALFVTCLVLVAVRAIWPGVVSERVFIVAAVVAALLVLLRFSVGLGFVPGAFTAVPLAALGAVSARRPQERVLVATALGALPLVWMLAWQGNHVAQWGGRYVLLSAALLTVLAVGPARRVGWQAPPVLLLTGLTVVLAVFGLSWHVVRTDAVARAVEAVEDVGDDVVIVSDMAHLGREGGAWYGDHRWLRTADDGTLDEAVQAAVGAGSIDLRVVELVVIGDEAQEVTTPGGLTVTGPEQRVPFGGGQELVVRDYRIG